MTDLEQKGIEIMAGLKDFQRSTAERVFSLLTTGHNRVLVADEVGLGKTLIAKGVIAKTALYHQQNDDDLFKVVYVCSNQSIAGQNLRKLKINDSDRVDDVSDTRLSMQHLKIFEDERTAKERNNYIQLIPLTPSTSFNITSGGGSVRERALIFAIMSRYPGLQECVDGLEIVMEGYAEKSWKFWAKDYKERVEKCDIDSNGEYMRTVLGRVDCYFKNNEGLLCQIKEYCRKIEQYNGRPEGANKVIYRLRRMMAEISVELMDPDLVIMDEFQRFPELINTDSNSETGIIAKRFFNAPKRDNEEVKILLLSATPYKLYSTLEEINENQVDEHYQDFIQLMNFLFERDPTAKATFRQVWSNYSMSLNEISLSNFVILQARKTEAENVLYQGICRTERLSIEGADRLIDIQTARGSLNVSEEDVTSYIQAHNLLRNIGLTENVPVDYIKSAPYIFSFMHYYKLKTKTYDYFSSNPDKLPVANKRELWLKEELVARYKKVPDTNARMKRLKEEALMPGAEHLMWIPPSRPYYEAGGPFARMKDFSKVLVFSAWEMVPRAIATLVSYEAERRTVGKLIQISPNPERENRSYFPGRKKVRFPAPRLKFNIRDGKPANMALMTLLYPSITLARAYDPIEAMNAGMTHRQIQSEIRRKIAAKLDLIKHDPHGNEDERWYSLAPLLLDLDEDIIKEWFGKQDLLGSLNTDELAEEQDEKSALEKHFEELRRIFINNEDVYLGRKPGDLVDILIKMAMGSPAVCALRLFGTDTPHSLPFSVRLAKNIVNRFNQQESIAIVELSYGSNEPHWKNVLQYCVDGNIQAMLDEFAHILIDDNGLRFVDEHEKSSRLCERMSAALNTHTASYNVDTFPKFRSRILKAEKKTNGSSEDDKRFVKMRSGYAVGFYETKGSDKILQRKENLRLAFNSPFRPFVLATTSIGQEGLDFHFYCRKIMHWNLPGNPIDLEQREGRINRYKGLAIRQNIGKRYGSILFKENIWDEMFEKANQEERKDADPELIPFWCLNPDDDELVKIERIVPMYPLSQDQPKYERLIKILSLYRLSLGHARQEELIDYVLGQNIDENVLKQLFINLSPYYKDQEQR